MALLIAVFSAIYAGVFAYHGMAYMPLIVANLLLVVVALLAPLAHRINDIAAALLLAAAEFIALVLFRPRARPQLGHPDQLHHRRRRRLRHLRHVASPSRGRGDR